MGKRLLDYDPISRTTSYFDYDPLTKQTIIYEEQDCEHFVEMNKARQNSPGYYQHGVKEEFAHVATIPNIIIHKWMKEGIDLYKKDDWPKIRRKLNDPDWKYLKTFTGKV